MGHVMSISIFIVHVFNQIFIVIFGLFISRVRSLLYSIVRAVLFVLFDATRIAFRICRG